jgi:hypothetical protein
MWRICFSLFWIDITVQEKEKSWHYPMQHTVELVCSVALSCICVLQLKMAYVLNHKSKPKMDNISWSGKRRRRTGTRGASGSKDADTSNLHHYFVS